MGGGRRPTGPVYTERQHQCCDVASHSNVNTPSESLQKWVVPQLIRYDASIRSIFDKICQYMAEKKLIMENPDCTLHISFTYGRKKCFFRVLRKKEILVSIRLCHFTLKFKMLPISGYEYFFVFNQFQSLVSNSHGNKISCSIFHFIF